MAATREDEYSALAPVLYLAFELGDDFWKLGFTVGMGQQPRERNIAARDLDGLQREIRLAKKRFGLPETAPVLSCYEAGRDGFWLHRYLVEHGVQNLVVDSSSIEVNRRQRRAKTDRMDVGKLLGQLIRDRSGGRKVGGGRGRAVGGECGAPPAGQGRLCAAFGERAGLGWVAAPSATAGPAGAGV